MSEKQQNQKTPQSESQRIKTNDDILKCGITIGVIRGAAYGIAYASVGIHLMQYKIYPEPKSLLESSAIIPLAGFTLLYLFQLYIMSKHKQR